MVRVLMKQCGVGTGDGGRLLFCAVLGLLGYCKVRQKVRFKNWVELFGSHARGEGLRNKGFEVYMIRKAPSTVCYAEKHYYAFCAVWGLLGMCRVKKGRG